MSRTKISAAFMLLVVLIATSLATQPGVAFHQRGKVQSASLHPGGNRQPLDQIRGNARSPVGELGAALSCMVLLGNGALSAAQQQCAYAMKLDSGDPAPYKLRAISYLMQKRFEQARVDFKEAVKLDPSDAESRAGYAEALRAQGRFAEAISNFATAIRLAPNDPRMWNARCWTRGSFDRELPKALVDCDTALRLAPGEPDILDSRGLVYLRMGKFNLAERDFSAALKRQPELATALYGRGIVRLRRGYLSAAQIDILGARELDPIVDDNFFWRPLISQQCLTRIVMDSGLRCQPSKRHPSVRQKPSANSKTAMMANHIGTRAPIR